MDVTSSTGVVRSEFCDQWLLSSARYRVNRYGVNTLEAGAAGFLLEGADEGVIPRCHLAQGVTEDRRQRPAASRAPGHPRRAREHLSTDRIRSYPLR